ncbi:hypothetical protein PA598K_06864 [Paenibacillus sp. 598K]|uniref:DUF4179 domain-containing protein n=1 Tax=Paenibacillus sp. 598K TaxID=1117987 RepID=UPI000FF971A3|nr:DUF4179 domain-containing protein [Paenibacillus sp. 598K]GBF78246.1 hypothetical protein PA598K_06864 [Paenibacillus sp. 598K]
MKPYDLEQELQQLGRSSQDEVPELIRQRQDQVYASLAELPAPAPVSRRRHGRGAWGAATAAALLIGVIGSAYVSPVMAASLKNVPIISSFYQLAGDLGLQTAEQRGLAWKSNASVTQDGVTLSVSEIAYDGTRLSLLVSRDGAGFEGGLLDSHTVQDVSGSVTTYPIGAISEMDIRIDDIPVHDYAMNQRPGLMMKPTASPDTIVLELHNYGWLEEQGLRLGESFDWSGSFKIEGVDDPFVLQAPVHVNTETVRMSIDETREWNGYRLQLRQLTFSPLTTSLQTRIEGLDTDDAPIRFELWDEQDSILTAIGGLGVHDGAGLGGSDDELLFDRLPHASEHLTLKAFRPIVEPDGTYRTGPEGELVKRYIPELEVEIPLDLEQLTQLYTP